MPAKFLAVVGAFLLLVAALPGDSGAEPPPSGTTPQVRAERPGEKSVAKSVAVSSEPQLSRAYYQALISIYEEQFGEAATSLKKLKSTAVDLGYINLPDYSFELLNRATAALNNGKREQAIFLVNHAVALSPEDARVNAVAATFHSLVGFKSAAGYAWTSFRFLMRHPIMLVGIVLNIFFVSLAAITISLFIVCMVQLIRSGELLFNTIAGELPRWMMGVGAIVGLLALFLLPIFGGILCATSCWGLALSRCKPSCRWLGAIAGALTLCWGVAIPVISTVGFNTESEANRVVEDINNFSFTPRGEEFIRRQLVLTPDDPLILFALGELFHLKGRYAEAQQAYQEVLKRTTGDEPLNIASKMNIGAVAFRDKQYQKAKEVFTELETSNHTSFELYYNLARTHMALLDTNAHRDYYAKAREISESRISEIEAEGSEDHQQTLMLLVPISFYAPLVTRSIILSDQQAFERATKNEQLLASTLFAGGSIPVLLVAGVFFSVLGVLSRMKPPKRYEFHADQICRHGSRLWTALPAGFFVAGDHPVFGSGVLACFLALLMLAFEAPISFYGHFPVEISFKACCILAAVILFCLLGLISMTGRFSPHAQQSA